MVDVEQLNGSQQQPDQVAGSPDFIPKTPPGPEERIPGTPPPAVNAEPQLGLPPATPVSTALAQLPEVEVANEQVMDTDTTRVHHFTATVLAQYIQREKCEKFLWKQSKVSEKPLEQKPPAKKPGHPVSAVASANQGRGIAFEDRLVELLSHLATNNEQSLFHHHKFPKPKGKDDPTQSTVARILCDITAAAERVLDSSKRSTTTGKVSDKLSADQRTETLWYSQTAVRLPEQLRPEKVRFASSDGMTVEMTFGNLLPDFTRFLIRNANARDGTPPPRKKKTTKKFSAKEGEETEALPEVGSEYDTDPAGDGFEFDVVAEWIVIDAKSSKHG
jgi:hypothetical protein